MRPGLSVPKTIVIQLIFVAGCRTFLDSLRPKQSNAEVA